LYERSDVDVRQLEGLEMVRGPLYGHLSTKHVRIIENELKYSVDIFEGHKTGFYLDQRENRYFAKKISSGLRVLDCFSYTGGFAISTLAGGATSVTMVDSSADALALAKQNLANNNMDPDQVTLVEMDVFKYLRNVRDKGETYDLVILDPPKFASTAAQAERASRGYKDINLLALKILPPGGYCLHFRVRRSQ
jgi:23S rRNA (cytosine1962-C5)-methyltransferase